MVESLTDKIRELTPKYANPRLVVGGKDGQKYEYNDEMERKFGVSEYWGFGYPTHEKGLVIDHINLCNQTLFKLEETLKQVFSDFHVKVDETGEYPGSSYSSSNFTERPWNEENTSPLFQDLYLKSGIIYQIGKFFQPFKNIAEYLFSLVYKEQTDFCDMLNQMPDCWHERVTQKERILILESEKGEQVMYTVTPRRYRSRGSIYVLEPGFVPFGLGADVPIMIKLDGFKYEDKKFRERHEALVTHDYTPLRIHFPEIPTQQDIEWNKFCRILDEKAKNKEYIKNSQARSVVDESLRNGLLTFSEVEPLIPGLYDGSIDTEYELIKDLKSKLYEIDSKSRLNTKKIKYLK